MSAIIFLSKPLKPANNSNVCSTVKNSGNESYWGQKPRFLRALKGLLLILNPLMYAVPLVALISPVSILKVVLIKKIL